MNRLLSQYQAATQQKVQDNGASPTEVTDGVKCQLTVPQSPAGDVFSTPWNGSANPVFESDSGR